MATSQDKWVRKEENECLYFEEMVLGTALSLSLSLSTIINVQKRGRKRERLLQAFLFLLTGRLIQ